MAMKSVLDVSPST